MHDEREKLGCANVVLLLRAACGSYSGDESPERFPVAPQRRIAVVGMPLFQNR